MIGVYVRVSSEMQRDNYSVGAQKDKGKTFALLMKDSYEIYDETKSGSTISERPEFTRMLADILAGKVTIVWAIEFSRLSRNIEDALYIRKVLVEHSVRLFIADTELDISTPEAVLNYNMKSSIAEYERSMIIQRVQRAKRKQKDSGEFVHSAILGYTSKFSEKGDRIWSIDESESAIVRMIFSMYSAGQSLIKIANYLNDNGFKTKRGKQYAANSISKILTHPEYFGKTKDADGQLIDSKVYMPIVDAKYLPLVAEAKIARAKTSDKFRESKNALSNILKCKRCGAPYYVHRMKEVLKKTGEVCIRERYAHRGDSTKQMACDQTHKYVDKAKFERLAELCYYYLFHNKDLVIEYAKKAKADLFLAEKDIITNIGVQDSLLAENEVKKRRLVDAVRDGVMSVDDIRESMGDLNRQKDTVEAVKKTLESSLTTLAYKNETTVKEWVFDKVSTFSEMDEARKKMLYKEIFSEYSIDGEMVTIVFFFGAELRFSYEEVKQGMFEDMDKFSSIIPLMFTWES